MKNGNTSTVGSVQTRSFFWSVFSRTQSEYGPEKTPYFDTFLAVKMFWNKVISKYHKNKYPTKFSKFI